ncbi:MAG TPA: ABC transporter permease [Puia sp.]|nr:ABC transporter permease [Puia sp.]
MIRNIFKTAWRGLRRNKITAVINIAGLALGITVCLIIFLLVRFELSYDRFHPGGDRIYRVVVKAAGMDGERDFGFVTMAVPNALRAEISGPDLVAAFDNMFTSVTVPRPGQGDKVFEAPKRDEGPSPIIIAQPQYFQIFRYQWLAGNETTALDEPYRVVLSAKEAEKYFGPRPKPDDYLGRQLIYQDSLRVTVAGIVADWTHNTDFAFGDFISYATITHSFLKDDYDPSNWNMWDYDAQALVRLAPGVKPAQVEQQFPAFLKRHRNSNRGGGSMTLSLQPLTDIHFNEKYPDDFSRKASLPTLYGLAAIAFFILVIAAINFINLSTAQSVRRAREIGVRKVLGGRRGALVIQFLSETLLLVIIAALLALAIANPILDVFGSLLPRGVHLTVFEWPAGLFLAVTVVVTSLLAGFIPARVLSSYRPVISLKGQGMQQLNGKSYLRKALIVFQFTISLVFIIGTLIIGRQIHYVLTTDLGFDKDAIVVIRMQQDGPEHRRTALANLIREIPAVQMVSSHIETPTAMGHPGTIIEYRGSGDHKTMASCDLVDTNYIKLYGMHLLAGRNLFSSDSSHEFLINQSCALQLGFRHPADALGQTITTGMTRGNGVIVGVLKDFHSRSLHDPITPFFLTTSSSPSRDLSVKLATKGQTADQLAAALGGIRKAWRTVYGDRGFRYEFFDESIARLYDTETKTARIMNIAMSIAIFISCLGLFGLAAFIAGQRTKEIGIRKVLGASVPDIVSMLSRDFIWLVGLAILIASPVAWWFMHRWLQDFAYRVSISWWIYAIAGVAAIGIALLTVSYQAIRAATANPVDSLKAD